MELNRADHLIIVVEGAECECCGLAEDCTAEYVGGVKAEFAGKWLCGLCAEAARDEAAKKKKKGGGGGGMEEAVAAHVSFCRSLRSSPPAVRVVDGMRQMLRRRSVELPAKRSEGKSEEGSSPAVGFEE
ncbi:uncharacterized protein LOC122005885 [Zingiber officinale]|uniref:DUF1677 family protein n=1 Tax=Zingiber officinale TaxID=94328 RepID=A0A8J5KMF5_ZINOF|nr:uncharacterized protein LOC122005885 [Zingiber officinale]KAG6489676.1 hypothetical protein ZIOFF_050952 [Zingiber officinale]